MARIPTTGVVALLGLVGCAGPPERAERLRLLAQRYHAKGEYRTASIVYRQALRLMPREGSIHFQLAGNEMKAGNYQAALPAYVRAFELGQGQSYDAYTPLSEMLLGHYLTGPPNARRVLEELETFTAQQLERHPTSVEPMHVRAALMAHHGDYRQAISLLRHALERRPGDARLQFALAGVLMRDNQGQEGERLAREALELHPGFHELYTLLYRRLMSSKRPAEALELRLRQVSKNPRSVEARLALLDHYLAAKMTAEFDRELNQFMDQHQIFPRAHLYAGDYRLQLGQRDEALKCYQRGVEHEPHNAEAYEGKIIDVYLRSGQYFNARKFSEELVRKRPGSPNAVALRGYVLIPTQPGEAVKQLERATAMAPNQAPFHYGLGLARREAGDLPGAEQAFERATRLQGGFVEALTELARVNLRRSKPARAEQVAREAATLAPDYLDARITLAEARIALGKWAQVQLEIPELTRLGGGHPRVKLIEGHVARGEGDLPRALQLFRQARLMAPESEECLDAMLEVLHRLGRKEEGRIVLFQELNRNTGNLRSKMAIANWDLLSGNYRAAAVEFRAIAQEHPRNPDAWAGLGKATFEAGHLKESETFFRKAIEFDPEHTHANLYLGMVLTLAERFAEARPLLEKSLQLAPADLTAMNNLAYVLAQTGRDLDQALALAQSAVSRAPNNPAVLDTLGLVYYKRSLYAEAARTYGKVVRMEPGNALYRYRYGLALLESGDRKAARAELTAALEMKPTPADRASIEQALVAARESRPAGRGGSQR
jgi:tetratricopeptide (TPR) repeat protein